MPGSRVVGLRASSRLREMPSSAPARRCRRKFLRVFPRGFRDETYLEWEREYKWEAHQRWEEALGRGVFASLLRAGRVDEIAARAIRVEGRARHSMLFSFEKMALRDALKTNAGARLFAEGLYEFLHAKGPLDSRFDTWVEAVASLPRRQTRVLTWPTVTVWGFLARPDTHLFVKPLAMRRAAAKYGFDLSYTPRPRWETYRALLDLAGIVARDLRDLRPRDMIDVQSFLWVQGSDEYE